MKYANPVLLIAFFSFATILLTACNNDHRSPASTPTAVAPKETSKGLPYRTGIDSNNAYSNLFLDSSQLEKFISHEKMDAQAANDIRSFYNNRAYQFAWFAAGGFTEQALAFRSLYDYQKDSANARKTLDNRLDQLINTDSLAPATDNPTIVATELMMSWRLVNYLNKTITNSDRKNAALENLVPYRKKTIAAWISAKPGDQIELAEKNNWFGNLKNALDGLVAIEQKGGWGTLPTTIKSYRNKKDPALVIRLKKRLIANAALEASDTSSVSTAALGTAIKKAQSQYGFFHDTTLTVSLLKELNEPVAARIQQVLMNLERMKWMPDLPDKEYILVNIPAYKLYVYNGSKTAFDMNIVTGKEGHSTVTFSGNLNQIVFSPYWNLTDSIVKKEVLRHIKVNKHYLEQQHMEQTGERNGIPVIRQLPGDWNELGKVKFLFPNSQQIYFHDTPHKALFDKDQRAYSHGCIRLAEPEKLAQFLLQENPSWTLPAIDSAMNSGKEKYVKLPAPVPVLIYYFSAWADESGAVQFRKDIYGHDADVAKRLFLVALDH